MKRQTIDMELSNTIRVGKNTKTGKIELHTDMEFIPTKVAERIANEVEDITIKALIDSNAKELTNELMMHKIDTTYKVTFWRFAAMGFALTTLVAILRLGGII